MQVVPARPGPAGAPGATADLPDPWRPRPKTRWTGAAPDTGAARAPGRPIPIPGRRDPVPSSRDGPNPGVRKVRSLGPETSPASSRGRLALLGEMSDNEGAGPVSVDLYSGRELRLRRAFVRKPCLQFIGARPPTPPSPAQWRTNTRTR